MNKNLQRALDDKGIITLILRYPVRFIRNCFKVLAYSTLVPEGLNQGERDTNWKRRLPSRGKVHINRYSPIKHLEREREGEGERCAFLSEFPVVIYQTGKIVSDGWTAARNDSSKSWEEEEEGAEEDGAKEETREEGECLGIASRAHAPRVRVCPRHPISTYCTHVARTCVCVRVSERVVRTRCVDPLIRGLIGRAGAIECQTGRTLRKSPVGAVPRAFLTESSRTRAAGNSIRCPCTAGSLSRQREANEHPAAGSPTYHTPALWEPFQRARQPGRHDSSRKRTRSVLEPEEPRRLTGPYALGPRAGQIRLLRTWGASFAFLEDARASSRSLLLPVKNFLNWISKMRIS